MQLERSLLTPEQVAWRLSVSTDTVYRLIRRGQLRAVRAGRRYIVAPEALQHFLERSEHENAEQLVGTMLGLGRLYVDKATSEGSDAYFQLASEKFRRAVALHPDDPLPRNELVRVLLLWGKEREASQAFRELEDVQEKARLRLRREQASRPS